VIKGWANNATPQPLYVWERERERKRERERERERKPVSLVQKDGWASGSARPGAANLVPTGAQTPNHQPLSESLYRPQLKMITVDVSSYAHKIVLSAN